MKIKITANDVATFKMIENHLNTLHHDIKNQIESAEENLIGLSYTIAEKYGVTDPIIYVPKTVKQIKTFATEIVIYCGDYVLRINESMMKTKIEYVFVEPLKNTDGHP